MTQAQGSSQTPARPTKATENIAPAGAPKIPATIHGTVHLKTVLSRGDNFTRLRRTAACKVLLLHRLLSEIPGAVFACCLLLSLMLLSLCVRFAALRLVLFRFVWLCLFFFLLVLLVLVLVLLLLSCSAPALLCSARLGSARLCSVLLCMSAGSTAWLSLSESQNFRNLGTPPLSIVRKHGR